MDAPSKKICPVCKKFMNPIRKGSLTSWILVDLSCACVLRSTISSISSFGAEPVAQDDAAIPDINNRYKAESLIEKTGMSFIFKSWDSHLEKHCVVKLIRSELAADLPTVQRFTSEARLCARFEHPNLLPVTDFGVTEKGLPFLIMDLIEGSSLRALLNSKQKLSIDESLALMIQICRGLQYAHGLSLIHRDLKPENILIALDDTDNPVVKIIDFGIAKIDQQGGEVQRLTQTGEVFGSVQYMSPEQCSGNPVDRRVDIYALGCILYELISGHPPFRGSTLMDVLNKQINDSPQQLTHADGTPIPKVLNDIVLKCLNKHPDDRFENAQELQRALEKLRSSNSAPGAIFSKASLALVAVLSLCIIVLTSMLLKPVEDNRKSNRIQEKTLLAALAERRKMPDFATRTYLSLAKSNDVKMLSDPERIMVSLLIINHLYSSQMYNEALNFFGSFRMPDAKTLKAASQQDKLVTISAPLIYSYIGRTEDRKRIVQMAELNFKEGIKLSYDLNSPPWVKAKLLYDLAYVQNRDKTDDHGRKELQQTIDLLTTDGHDYAVVDSWGDLYAATTSLDKQLTQERQEADAIEVLLKVIDRIQNVKSIPAAEKKDLIERLAKHYDTQGMTKEANFWRSH